MSGPRRYRYSRPKSLIGLTALCQLGLVGCGVMPTSPFAARTLFVMECNPGTGAVKTQDVASVVLDWTGGINPIYPDTTLAGIDLTQFPTTDGLTLADHEEAFKNLVEKQIAEIFCVSGLASVAVINGESDKEGLYADTVVHITQEIKPDGGTDIGQGEFDPCDLQHDNAAVIFGRRIQQLGGAFGLDEWVNVFANVTAHEIAHTLGFGHIAREDRPEVEPQRALFVELMLDRHTMSEMRRPQRFLVQQNNCVTQSASMASTIQGAVLWDTH